MDMFEKAKENYEKLDSKLLRVEKQNKRKRNC